MIASRQDKRDFTRSAASHLSAGKQQCHSTRHTNPNRPRVLGDHIQKASRCIFLPVERTVKNRIRNQVESCDPFGRKFRGNHNLSEHVSETRVENQSLPSLKKFVEVRFEFP